MDRGQDIGIDSILKQAWQSIDDMTAHTDRLYVCIAGPLGRAGPHDLVGGCRKEVFANLTKRV